MNKLEKWAVIDIETTGIDESYDEIIDLGYLQFEGTKLVRKYSSLVRTEKPLSKFIQKLTGITPSMVKNAPLWSNVEPDLFELEGHDLVAHNAAFEKKFLSPFFDEITMRDHERYVDTLSFFGLAYPEKQKLGLEGLLVGFGIVEEEQHRGYEDSLDLLKMILFTLEYIHRDKEKDTFFKHRVSELDADYWGWPKFCAWTRDEFLEVSEQIDFDVVQYVDNYVYGLNKTDDITEKFLTPKSTFSSETIKSVLEAGSEITEVFPGYQPRESQLQMSLRVGQAFGNSIHSLIQAPTGTGKTLAYMLPASLFAKSGKGKVLVATGTKTLQEQLMTKDIPILRQVIGDEHKDLEIVRLVGSGNHFCELLFDENKKSSNQESMMKDHGLNFTEQYLQMIFFHNAREASENRVLLSQVPYILKIIIPNFIDTLSENKVDFRSCIGSQCPHSKRCSYLQGLRDAKDADIIIGNHALMFHWPRGIDRPEHIIVDEAHKIEGEASEAYSLSLDQRQFDSLLTLLDRGQGVGALFYLLNEDDKEELVDELRESVKPLNIKLRELQQDLDLMFESYFKKSSRYNELYWNELPMIAPDYFDELGKSLRRKIVYIRDILEEYYELLHPFEEKYEDKTNRSDASMMAIARFESLMASLEDSYVVLKTLLSDEPMSCQQLLYHADSGYQMKVTPIDVGKKIKEDLLDKSASVVFTSATLANKDGSRGTLGVEWMTGYSYLTPDRRFKKGTYLDAVFDYKNATQVYLATDTPRLNDIDFIPVVTKKIAPMIEELGGRTLMLFSSRKRFEQACEKMLELFEGKLNVYIQGMGAHVVESFKEDERAVLIGMESFGEGIDIPGDSLQLVYIDKVPDVRVSLLTNDRRTFFEKQFGNEFVDYYLAHRTRSLHQKLGRLLRRESDRGAIIITDSRLKNWKGRTIGQFKDLMEPYDIQICDLEVACQGALDFIQQQ